MTKAAKFEPGQKIGLVTLIEFYGTDGNGKKWVYVCECGNRGVALESNLKRKTTRLPKSCGCAKKKHGLSAKRVYEVWASMMKRCYNKGAISYPRYGGRGITVCKEWHDVQVFARDMGEPPLGMSIDRIDNNRGYSKDNCRWATQKEQAQNRRSNRLLTFNGATKRVGEWKSFAGVPPGLISARIDKLGWDEEKAISTPVGGKRRQRLATGNYD